MDRNFEDIIRDETNLSPLVARKGYWYRATGPVTLIRNMEIIQFSMAINTLVKKYRDVLKGEAEIVQQYCDLEIEEIEERISALINQKIIEFQVEAKRRGHDLEYYI